MECPRCGQEVVYNGNYFCSSYARDWCGWALSDKADVRPYVAALEAGKVQKVGYRPTRQGGRR